MSAGLLSQGFGVRFSPKGASMFPTIKDGEIVTVEPIEPRHVKRGDIILYKTRKLGSPLIAHRVVSVRRDKRNVTAFILRGDASQSDDAPIEPGQVLGRVISVEREGRNINLTSRRAWLTLTVRRRLSEIKARAYYALEPEE